MKSLAPRRSAAGLFLLAAAALGILIGGQTLLAIRSQQRISERALHDHAATALWYFEQNLESELSRTVECVFHDALHTTPGGAGPYTLRTGIPHPVAPPVERLLDTWFPEGECVGQVLSRPATVFRFGPAEGAEWAGAPATGPYSAALRVLVEAAVRERPFVRRTDGVVPALVAGEPRLVLYSRQQLPAGEAIYVVPLEPRSVGVIAARATREFRLLPPPVLPDSARGSVMRLTLGLPGDPMFRTTAAGAAVARATRDLSSPLDGLVATAEVTPLGAALLGQPPMHAARLPGMVALLLLSLGLVLLAYRQLRREQELAALRGDFVASVSHELRTPLALQRILLDTISLGRVKSPKRMAWAIENIDREARRLEHLVSNILHFARSERGQLELDLRPAELVAAVQRGVAAFRPLAEQRGASIVVLGEPPVDVDLDPVVFDQALGNVLENAIKYGPDGQRITVRVAAEASWAAVDVEDEGPGLPPDEREEVLEPFRRGRSTRGGAIAGSGIGLAVVSKVLALHGGRVALDATDRGGLRVRLMLPVSPRFPPGRLASAPADETTRAGLAGRQSR